MNPNLTDEQKKDVEERTKAFMQKYEALVEECQIDFMNYPIFTPNQDGTWGLRLQVQAMDKKYALTKSPFVPTS